MAQSVKKYKFSTFIKKLKLKRNYKNKTIKKEITETVTNSNTTTRDTTTNIVTNNNTIQTNKTITPNIDSKDNKDNNNNNNSKKMYKIAFFDAKEYDINSFNSKTTDEYELKFFETKLTVDTAILANGYDVVCVFVNDDVNKDVIDALVSQDVKLLALRCAGYNNVDLKYAAGKLPVVRVPAYSPYAVAEHAMALLLTSIRRIHKAYIRTKDFNFSLNELTGFDFHGKTVGVVGTGKIGKIFINICKGFGMNVIAYDKFQAKDCDINYVTLDEIWEKSDIISLHCPLTDETYHVVNEESVEKMKKGVAIVNTSRGALIDSKALMEGIKKRKIGAACLDVYEEESNVFFNNFSGHIIEDDVLARLISFPNVIVTSHQAFLTREALANIATTTLGNVKQFFTENKCDNEVVYNPEESKPTIQTASKPTVQTASKSSPTANKPSPTANKPSPTGSKPSPTGSKPSPTGSKPSPTGSKPSPTGSKPSPTAGKPAGKPAAKPNTTAGKPAAKPNTTAAKPSTQSGSKTNLQSGSKTNLQSGSKPNPTASKPKTAASKPNTTANKPSTAASKPNTAAAKPSTAASKPSTAASKPNIAAQ